MRAHRWRSQAAVLPYAILPRTWGKDEVTLQDMQTRRAEGKEGFKKCIWVDTCCIDKTTSADLGESINSMYRWYSRSSVCYAHLSDVADPLSGNGWTLQESIAPKAVNFYSQSWEFLGSREDEHCLNLSCTRSEDVAYSLIGIFGVIMALLYGEGEKAFTRLDSPRAWTLESIFAKSPTDFAQAGGIVKSSTGYAAPFAISNWELKITLPLARAPEWTEST
ncbi:HET-domain-containing protein [Xylariomycetidae sp. FL0641]|nr:HET-domain-containing protein [Xylariomycetidae sp. FL0641]